MRIILDPRAGAPMYVVWAGKVDYLTALGWQDQLVAARQADQIDDVLLLVTHPPVYTAGRHANIAANLTGQRPDIPVVRVDRGGDLTYHGPGQVVAYPIMRLPQRGASLAYVTALEQALIATLDTYRVAGVRRPGYPGVWVRGPGQSWDKIAAVGVRITRGISKHGVALNVEPDLDDYRGIIACGISDGGVTSLGGQGVTTDIEDVRTRLAASMTRSLRRSAQPAGPSDLGLVR
ncbi:MAG: lipoyl(octanoyl) transferase LipB [Euzebya sp.]